MNSVKVDILPLNGLYQDELIVIFINWLFAKKFNSKFIINFAEIFPRSLFLDYKDIYLKSLSWLNLNPDFIIEKTEENSFYRKLAIEMVKNGYAYPCFCFKKDIIKRNAEKKLPEGIIPYDGYCRNLTFSQVSEKISCGLKPAYRFKTEFSELADIFSSFPRINDFVILKSNGSPAFIFSSNIDSISIGITHIIKSEEYIYNTFKQILISRALNVTLPKFIHIPVFLGSDGKKYSRSKDAFTLLEFKRMGFLPAAILNYLFHKTFPGERKLLSPEEMIEKFEVTKISKSYGKFDMDYLKYLNKKAIQESASCDLENITLDFMKSTGLLNKEPAKDKIILMRGILPELKKRSSDELAFSLYPIISKYPLYSNKAKKYITLFSKEIDFLEKIVLNYTKFEKIKKQIISERERLGKVVRIAITGEPDGVPLDILLENITLYTLKERIKFLIDNLRNPDIRSVKKQKENIEKNRLKYYFEKVFKIKIVKIKQLNSFRNICWKVICGKEIFVVKKAVEADWVKFYNEKEVMKNLGPTGLTPEEPYLDISKEYFPEPLLIYRWVKGRPLKNFSKNYYEIIADYLCKIHSYSIRSLPLLPVDSIISLYNSLKSDYYNYVRLKEIKNNRLSDLIFYYISLIEPVVYRKNYLWEKGIPSVVLHGDLRPSNFILDKKRIVAIDWEEAHLGDPAYEVSWLFKTNSFALKEEKFFLNTYLKIYNEKFGEDIFFKERVMMYNLINSLLFYLNMAIRCMNLKSGKLKNLYNSKDYINMEMESIYKGFAFAFNNINKMLNLKEKKFL